MKCYIISTTNLISTVCVPFYGCMGGNIGRYMHTLVLYKRLGVFRTIIILIGCHEKTTLFIDKLILDIITSIIPRL